VSTLVVRAPHAPKAWLLLRSSFARIASIVLTVIDVFTEAQRQVYEAQQRYPFTAW
jgi:hypothetical protein